MLRLPDALIWDSWIADDGPLYHLFFLMAARVREHPSGRHLRATIGHATSVDLRDWEYLGTALRPATGTGAWDDLALWTGSVARGDDGTWRMYYTALSSAGRGIRDQRIGIAESEDLRSWRRVGEGPAVEVDPRWYRAIEGEVVASETWRDPFVYRDPAGDGWHMLITARARDARRGAGGVLAHARSADMLTWEVGPPVCRPGPFGHLEVPQVRLVDGRPLLVFTCHPDDQEEEWRRAVGAFSTWTVAGESMTGPWDLTQARPFREEPALFAAPLVRERDGGWALLGFRNLDSQGIDACEIIDPIRVRFEEGDLVGRDVGDDGG